MRNLLLTAVAITIALSMANLHAAPSASLGGECRTGSNVVPHQYLCQFGNMCLKAIGKMYCSNLGKVCGWPGKVGYTLGAKKTYNGKQYECKVNGFQQVSSTSGGSTSGGSTSGNQSGTIGVPGVIMIPTSPKIRSLKSAEKSVANSVFGNSINLGMVRVTNTVGLQERAWTTNSPPLYTINVGVNGYKSLTASDGWKGLLIHELTHVWQGQHGIPFMSNSAVHQTLAAIQSGGATGGAYNYQPGKQWSKYNSEQQASIVAKWYRNGRKTSDVLYPYIRDNVRPGKPNAKTIFSRASKK